VTSHWKQYLAPAYCAAGLLQPVEPPRRQRDVGARRTQLTTDPLTDPRRCADDERSLARQCSRLLIHDRRG